MSVLAEDNIPVVKQTGGYNTKKPIKFLTSANVQAWITSGTGAPSAVVPQGSLYLRTDGSSTSTRLYVASDSAGTWVAVTTAS